VARGGWFSHAVLHLNLKPEAFMEKKKHKTKSVHVLKCFAFTLYSDQPSFLHASAHSLFNFLLS